MRMCVNLWGRWCATVVRRYCLNENFGWRSRSATSLAMSMLRRLRSLRRSLSALVTTPRECKKRPEPSHEAVTTGAAMRSLPEFVQRGAQASLWPRSHRCRASPCSTWRGHGWPPHRALSPASPHHPVREARSPLGRPHRHLLKAQGPTRRRIPSESARNTALHLSMLVRPTAPQACRPPGSTGACSTPATWAPRSG